VKELLKKKADLATRLNPDGFSPIHIASANGFVEIVRELLMVNSELGRLKSSDGRTSLHCAAINGMVHVIKELLKFCPASKDIVTFKGETAFHLAVRNNQFEAFKAMVDVLQPHNIKELLNVTDEDGNTVLHLATAKRQTQASPLSLLSLLLIFWGALGWA
jgi:ankyrin repeat protein